MPREKLHKVILSLAVITLSTLATAGMMNIVLDQEDVHLEDIIKNPENYLGEKNATFAITNVTLRPDPYGRLKETYYLVHITDSYKYNASFVILERECQNHTMYIDEWVAFDLIGTFGPELMQPPDRLITHILTSKAADPYYRQYYRVFIYLSNATIVFKVDLNYDGVINIIDIRIVAIAFGSYPSHPRWDPRADLDGNELVDIVDLYKVAKEFGKTY